MYPLVFIKFDHDRPFVSKAVITYTRDGMQGQIFKTNIDELNERKYNGYRWRWTANVKPWREE